MSYHRLSVKPLNVTLNALMKRVAHVGLGVGAFTPILAMANPTGGQVVAGQATIAAQNSNGLVVNQASQAAIINWQQFSIGKGQYVQFLQPSSSSVVLNRVVGGNATSILGNLTANGQVFLVNPNGIFFGRSSMLDVQGIVASSLDIKNSDFLTGNYVFQKGTGAANASVVNQGSISTRNGGYVVLAGDYSENDGIIQARSGHVVLAGGSRTTLTLSGNSLVNFAVNDATLAELAGAKNTGSLIADGGTVVMTADVANALKATVVNNMGLIEAHAINKDNGAIYLTATGGNIVNAGTLDADAGRAGQVGGNIVLKTDGFTNLTSTSKITATGQGADGGHLEVSGRSINVRGSAKLGKGGNMLLDPGSMSIVAGTASINTNHPGLPSNNTSVGHIGVGFIQTQLNAGANVNISAANTIKETGVPTISATGTGTLHMQVGTFGHINLSNTNITIGGAFTASMGYGSFGILQAKSINLKSEASGGFVHLKDATSAAGVVSKYSAKATAGNVTISATHIEASGEGALLAIDAHGGSVHLTGNVNIAGTSSVYQGPVTLLGKSVSVDGIIKVNGNVNITASAGALDISNVFTTGAGDNVTLAATGGNLSAGQIEAGNALNVTDTTGNVHLGDIAAYGGALTVTDTTGNMTVGIVSGGHAVTLNDAGHTLSFAHSAGFGNATVFAGGNLTIKAATIQTAGNSLDLKESGGSAGIMTVKGVLSLAHKNLVLDDAEGGSIDINQKIVARQVTIDANKLAFIGAGSNLSISASDGGLTLNAGIGSAGVGAAKYNVNLKNEHGYGIFIEKSIFTGNTAGGLAANVTATEIGHVGSSHTVNGVLVGNSSGAAVTVAAAGSVVLKGWDVGVGNVGVKNPLHSAAPHFGSIAVKAGKNVTFSASGNVSNGGQIGVQAQNITADSDTKNTSILVQAGGNIKFVGKKVDLRAGSAHAFMASAHSSNGTANANANVSLKAGGNVTLTGGASNNGGVFINGGNAIASGDAMGSHVHKTNANANVSITSTKGNIAVSGHEVRISGGYGAHAEAFASGAAGTMTATANANVAMTAAGTISLTAGTTNSSSDVRLVGGSQVGHNGYGIARGANEQATATAHADVSLNAAGITLTGAHVDVSGGKRAGRQSPSGSNHIDVAQASNGTNAVATYTATANVNLTAGSTGIAITGSGEGGSAHIHGGSSNILRGASASAHGTKSKATAIASARVNIVDAGAFSALTNGHVDIQGGGSVAAHTKVEGNVGGSAALTGDGGVSLSATSITIGSAGGHSAGVNIGGGGRAASHGKATAGSYGGATLTGLSSVSMTGTGALKIAGGNNIIVNVGIQGANLASASASHHGKAAVDAGAKVSLQGTSVKIASANQGVEISVGYGVAGGAKAHASYGSAAVTAAEGISITATAGNMVLSGKNQVNVRGGNSAAAGFGTHHSFSNSTHGFGSHGSTEHTHHSVTGTSYTSVTAKGAGASALVNGAAGVSLTAKKGTLTIAQTNNASGSLRLGGGSNAASAAHASASNGATATVSGTSALSITAGNLTVTGHKVGVFGGGGAARGAGTGEDSHTVHGSHFSGTGLHPFSASHGTTAIAPKTNTAKGTGAIAKVSGDGSVTIKSGTVSLTANGSLLEISAGYGGGSHGQLKASNGGLASISAKTGVAITATVAYTAIDNGNFLGFRGAGDSGARAVLDAQGAGAKALMNVNGAVTLSAPTVTLNGANNIFIQGGNQDASHAAVIADLGGSAALTANGGANITVTTTFTADLTGANANGGIDIFGGHSGGVHALASASGSGAKATLANNSDVNITATAGTITLLTGSHAGGKLSINAGGQTAHSMAAKALQGNATATVSGNVNLSALGAISLKATKGDIHLNGVNNGGMASHALAGAGAGAKAAVNISDNINLTGGAVSLKAGTFLTGTHNSVVNAGSIGIKAGLSNLGKHADASASNGGSAVLDASTQVNIKATGGNLTINAGQNLQVGSHCCSAHNIGSTALAKAGGGSAKAALAINDGVLLQAAGAVTLTAGENISITTASGPVHAGASAGFKGTATYTQNQAINIVAGGTFTAKAGTDLSFFAGFGNGGDFAHADHVGGQATFQSDGSLNITANVVALSGGESVGLFAGNRGGVAGNTGVSNGATAAFTTNRSLNVTAKNSITMTLTGKASGGSIGIGGGSSVGLGAEAHASHNGGKATMSNIADLNLKVTGATGSITLNAGSHTGADVSIDARAVATRSGVPAAAFAGKGGSAMVTDSGNLNLSAKGAITLNAAAGGRLNVIAGGHAADSAKVSASSGGKATLDAQAGANISGGTVTLTAGSNITITGASRVAEKAGVHGKSGGVAALTALDGTTIISKGALTVTAGSNLTLMGNGLGSSSGPSGRAGQSASVTAHSGGAQAALTVTDGVRLTAATVALKATKGSLNIVAGSDDGKSAKVHALTHKDKATLNVDDGIAITATGAISLNAGKDLAINGGSNAGESASVTAGTFAAASMNATAGVNIKTGAAFTATAGSNLAITGDGANSGGHAAQSAAVKAQSGNALANLTVTDGVQLTAATVALKATKGNLSIAAGSDAGDSANVHAQTQNDKATLNVDDGIAITITGAISLNAGKNLTINGGRNAGESASVTAGGSHGSFAAAASMNATAGVNIKAGGAFSAKAANGNLAIDAGSHAGASAFASADGNGAVIKFSANSGINITATAISLTAAVAATSPGGGSLTIAAGDFAGRSAAAKGSRSGHVAYSALSAVNLSATGAIALTAKGGDLNIRAGSEGFAQGHLLSFAGSAMHASGSGGGVAKAAANSSVNLTAGGALGLSAKGNIAVSGGYGEFAIVNAILGSASVALNGGANLKAGGALTATAGGTLTLHGGNEAGIAAQQLFQFPTSLGTPPPGVVNGTVNSGVSLAAGGAVTLTAGGNVTVAAGNGETLAVGKVRSFLPSATTTAFFGANIHSWGGGSANLSANLGVAVTAGTALTVTAGAAGAGSLKVLGLGKNPGASAGFQNVVSVRGGSSHAVANLTLNGNATLTAGTDMFINAAGNASIAGGALFNIRVDGTSFGTPPHTEGNITLTGSANATVHAGLDVMLNNIKGSLTLAGANAGPSAQEMLVDAHGNSGTINVTGHADALISAGRDVVTVTKMGGGLNLIAGSFVDALAVGSASNQHATGTASATIKAGRNVIISATGGLNLLGGNFDRASVSASRVSNAADSAALTARADITAGGKAKLSVGGNAFVAGGDSLHATAKYASDSFMIGTAVADVGTGIQGGAVTLTVAGNLKARGGSGAKASVTALGASNASFNATANAGVNIAAKTGTLAITANGASASFLGGSGITGKAEVVSKGDNANAIAHSDLNLSAGGAMLLTIKGKLLVAGGADADQFGTDIGGAPAGRLSAGSLPANNSKTNVTATGAVKFTAGSTLTVAQSGGDLSILAGSRGASFASVNAVGSNAKTSLTVDTGVSITAGGALTFTGAHNVHIMAGPLASGATKPSLNSIGPGAQATATVNNSVKLTGTSVHIAHTGTFTTASSGSFTHGGLTLLGSFSSAVVAPPVHGLNTLNVRIVGPQTDVIHVAPLATQSSFGGAKTLSGMPVTDISDSTALQPTVLDTSSGISVDVTAQPLATLQETSLVTNLVTLVGAEATGLMAASSQIEKATLFTPVVSNSGYSSSFSGACVALVVSRSGQSRCSVAGSK